MSEEVPAGQPRRRVPRRSAEAGGSTADAKGSEIAVQAPAAPAASLAPPTELSVPTELEAAYAKGAAEGFCLRGTKLGRDWYADLKSNPKTATAYREVGKSYGAQDAFRLRWAAAKSESMAHARRLTSERTESEDEFGTYENADSIKWHEHNEEAGLNYCKSAETLFDKGILFMNRVPFARVSSMTHWLGALARPRLGPPRPSGATVCVPGGGAVVRTNVRRTR